MQNPPFYKFFFDKSFLNLLKPRGVNTAKADRTVTAQSEKSIICKKSRLTALHAGIVLTPPLRPDIVLGDRGNETLMTDLQILQNKTAEHV